ncbi:Cytochrome P450, E-class, group I [Parasponia andersonii]|uniref:Cytochrome P450, E-class, group I n=1 Tax=Parasponia andersonii TaxID=3476 RepID=A0A2P5AB75_PARAD|nr:Cytochrome P450, E-class, group I [Parasponia andersonii]
MESWVFLVILSVLIHFLLNHILKSPVLPRKLPPGPLALPIIGNLRCLRKSSFEMKPILRDLHAKYGPIISLRIGPRPTIYIADRSVAHQALIQNGAVFADRPAALSGRKIVSSNQYNINSAGYGSTWRLLRRNLTWEILRAARVKSYSSARNWVLDILLGRLGGSGGASVLDRVMDHFQYAMFCLLVLMCFGHKLEETKMKEIEIVQRRLLLGLKGFETLNLWPSFTKILLKRRWNELLQLRKDQEGVLVPLVNSRREKLKAATEDEDFVVCYVDTLLGLELPEEGNRNLNMGEIVSLCSEFLNAGTDTTSTALQWIMANIVKHPEIQEKLYEEIKRVVAGNCISIVQEEHLHKISYLKAVILEGLRRHPPSHFGLTHAATEDVILEGFVVPKEGSVNFEVAEIGRDPKVWEDPMAFKPERFLVNDSEGGSKVTEFDLTGIKEIKMMPFGAGRRMCPGYSLAMLHLEFFVANLVWRFEWTAAQGDEIDLSEKQEIMTVFMKNPLKVRLSPRTHH